MQRKRSYHAVSVVSSEDVLPYCVTRKRVVTNDDSEKQFNDDVVPPVGFSLNDFDKFENI